MNLYITGNWINLFSIGYKNNDDDDEIAYALLTILHSFSIYLSFQFTRKAYFTLFWMMPLCAQIENNNQQIYVCHMVLFIHSWFLYLFLFVLFIWFIFVVVFYCGKSEQSIWQLSCVKFLKAAFKLSFFLYLLLTTFFIHFSHGFPEKLYRLLDK